MAACICSSPSLLWWNPESLTCHHSRPVKFDNTLCVSGRTPSIQGNERVICCHDSYQNSAREHIIEPRISPSVLKGWKILSLSSSETSLGCQLRSQLPWKNSGPGWHWEPSPTHNRCGRKKCAGYTAIVRIGRKNPTAKVCWGCSCWIKTKRSVWSMLGTHLRYQCQVLLNRRLNLLLFLQTFNSPEWFFFLNLDFNSP